MLGTWATARSMIALPAMIPRWSDTGNAFGEKASRLWCPTRWTRPSCSRNTPLFEPSHNSAALPHNRKVAQTVSSYPCPANAWLQAMKTLNSSLGAHRLSMEILLRRRTLNGKWSSFQQLSELIGVIPGQGSIGPSLALQHVGEGLCERVSVARPPRRNVIANLDDKRRRRIVHRITLQARSLSMIVRICLGNIAEILRACKRARHFLLH